MASNKRSINEFFQTNQSTAKPAGYGSKTVTGHGINDRRARLSPKPLAFTQVLGPKERQNILFPLYHTNGLMFPYTPNITESTSVNYEMTELTHSNQPIASFKNGGPKELQVTGMFTAQNDEEAQYCFAAIHYIRTVTKMFFGVGGQAAEKRGTPPPILMFNAYGTGMFHNLPVIVTSAAIEYPMDVDYVEVNVNTTYLATTSASVQTQGQPNNSATSESRTNAVVIPGRKEVSAWVPSKFNIALTLNVQNTPNRLKKFDLDEFRQGALIKNGGWI